MIPSKITKLKLLPVGEYVGVNRDDPIRFYSLPVIGGLYRRRVELCLGELSGGERVLEVGFGSGVVFLNLCEIYQEIHGLDLTAHVNEVTSFFETKGIHTHLKNGSVLEMPYKEGYFDAVLLVSILEHLRPAELRGAFQEIRRILKPGGQVVYGVPVERPLMVFLFKLLGYDIHQHHFSTEKSVYQAACQELSEYNLIRMRGLGGLSGPIYEVGHFKKTI